MSSSQIDPTGVNCRRDNFFFPRAGTCNRLQTLSRSRSVSNVSSTTSKFLSSQAIISIPRETAWKSQATAGRLPMELPRVRQEFVQEDRSLHLVELRLRAHELRRHLRRQGVELGIWGAQLARFELKHTSNLSADCTHKSQAERCWLLGNLQTLGAAGRRCRRKLSVRKFLKITRSDRVACGPTGRRRPPQRRAL